MLNEPYGNDIVEQNFCIGGQQLQPYKEIIKKCAYPSFGGTWSLEPAWTAVNAFEKSGGSKRDQFELKVFFLECGVFFVTDFCCYEDDSNEFLENCFETVLQALAKQDKALTELYLPRMKAMVESASDCGGLDEQLSDYWQDVFGE